MSDVSSRAIEQLYALICRDPMTAEGGITPNNVILHAEQFVRYERGKGLDTESGSAIDRKVMIRYLGTSQRGEFGHPTDVHRFFRVSVDVGYHFGDHVAASQGCIADDEHDIMATVGAESSKVAGTFGYLVQNASVQELQGDRAINQIIVEVQVNGAC